MSDPVYLELAEWGGHDNGFEPGMVLPARELWAHHSVTNEDSGGSATEDASADFRELDSIGLSRRHGGISYSYAIHPSGVIGEGQGTGRGAHTGGSPGQGDADGYGHNRHSFGVVFVGNYDDDELTPAAIESFRWLRDVLIHSGALAPGVYPTGGHQDAPGNATGCPGRNIEAKLDVLRAPYEGGDMTPDEVKAIIDEHVFTERPFGFTRFEATLEKYAHEKTPFGYTRFQAWVADAFVKIAPLDKVKAAIASLFPPK